MKGVDMEVLVVVLATCQKCSVIYRLKGRFDSIRNGVARYHKKDVAFLATFLGIAKEPECLENKNECFTRTGRTMDAEWFLDFAINDAALLRSQRTISSHPLIVSKGEKVIR